MKLKKLKSENVTSLMYRTSEGKIFEIVIIYNSNTELNISINVKISFKVGMKLRTFIIINKTPSEDFTH